MLSRMLRAKSIMTISLALILAVAVYGFAAANTVPETGAGDGQNTISGYTITNVRYTLNNANPAQISSVAFNVTPTAGAGAANDVRISLDGGTNWVSCIAGGGGQWSCTVSIAAAAATQLRVVAVQ